MAQTAQQPARPRTGREFPYVLMYHSVTRYDDDPYLVTVCPERFERQLRWLRSHGCTGVSMGELLAARRVGADRGLVGLTFDDGYTDFAGTVVPLLRRFGWTATVFVIAGRLGGVNDWDPEGPRKQPMSEQQVAAVAAAGMEVGSHGLWHRRLPELPATELAAETERSRAVLREITGVPVGGFCYPYGAVDAESVSAVRAAGYEYGCAIWRSELSGRHALPRTYIGERDGSLRLGAKRMRHRFAARAEIPAPRLLRIR